MEEEIKKEIIGKAGFPLYVDYWDKYFSLMSGEQVKEVLEIVYHFNKTYEINQSKDLSVVMVVNTIVDNIKRDASKRLKQSRANRDNGKKGGRPIDDKKPKKIQSKPKETQLVIPNFIESDLWNSFLLMRQKAKAPPTEKAIGLIIKDLTKFENKKQGDANIALENSIKNNWKGVFEPKSLTNYQSQSPLKWLNK